MACWKLSKIFTNTCFALCIAVLSWILIAGLITNSRSPQSLEEQEKYGFNQVSGFYGPGSWGAWLLTVISCLIRRKFAKEKPVDEKYAHLAGMDIDFVVAYGYPVIAAMDTLLHLRYYTSDEFSEKDLGRLAASLLLTRLGAAVGGLLLLNRTAKTKMHTSATRELILCTVGCLVSTVALRIFNFEYMYHLRPLSVCILAVVAPLPIECAESGQGKETAADFKLKTLVDSNWSPQLGWIYGMPLLPYSPQGEALVFWDIIAMFLVCLTMVYAIGFWFGAWKHGRVRIKIDLPLACCVLIACLGSKMVYHTVIELVVMLASLCLHPSLALPRTSAALSDLDQTSTLILSGGLIIVGCVWDLYLSSLWARLNLMPVWLSRYRLPEGYHLSEWLDLVGPVDQDSKLSAEECEALLVENLTNSGHI